MRILIKKISRCFLNRKKDLGFSLIEMIVVLAIILIVSSIILAQYAYSQKRHKLQKAAQEFALNVRWAQGLALETRKVSGALCTVPEGFGVWVENANTYKIFFNCNSVPPKKTGSSIIYKTFNLASGLSFFGASTNKDVFFLKPNPDCYANGWRNMPPPNCALEGCYQNFTIQNSAGQNIIIKVDDSCRVSMI